MVNKKGFLRIVESTIAVMIILVTLILLSSQRSARESNDLSDNLAPLLDEIARNLTLREKIVSGSDEEAVEREIEGIFVSRLDNPFLSVSVELCSLEEVCFLEPYPDTDEDIFSSERIISGSVKNETFAPKKVKVFLWRNTV